MTETRSRLLRLTLFAVVIAGVCWGLDRAGYLDDVSVERIRAAVDEAGGWGVLIYLLIFCVGVLLYVPGFVFISAGILAFGKVHGSMLALLGGVLSASVSVALFRAVGGSLLQEIEKPWVKGLLSKLHERPCLLYTSPSPRDRTRSRMPSSA